ncbi:MAG TPA: ABC transporter permease [Candidatus Sulfotelmatobacter sp.]|nr:ABC transporter permease [Candidatus Sulfotelmatobacter sp.]
MHILVQEFRYAVRQLYNSPGFAVTVVLTLALGIGVNSAIFSVMNAVLLRGLPVPNPQELVYLHVPTGQPDGAGNTGNSSTSFSEPVFEDLRQDHHAFADLIAFVPLAIGKVAVRFGDTPEEAEGDMVSGNFFSGLGISPARGRGFTLDDERAHSQVVVLSYSYWTRRFARNPSVLGQTFFIKGIAFTITGIGPEKFFGVDPGQSTDFWIPLQNRPDLNAWGTPPEYNTLYGTPTWWCLELIARLAPGVSQSRALAEVTPRFERVAYTGLTAPDSKAPKVTLALQPARGIEGLDTGSNYKTGVTVLMTLVSLVLVIACTNVAMLLVAKKSARQREFSLRLALGASWLQIFRQLLLESILLVGIGGILGWMFALAATHALAAWSQIESGLDPDASVLLFTLVICGVASLVFGLAPLIPALRVPVAGALKASASTSYRTRIGRWGGKAVIVMQMTFCFVLLVAAGLLLRTLKNYQSTNLGMRAHGLLVFGITPQKTASTSQNVQFYRALLDRLRTLPGVESATYAENRPGSGWSDNNAAVIDGVKRPYSEAPLRSNDVGPDFFHVLGVPVVEGRDLSDADTEASARVAVVNETFGKKLMPGVNPIGHQLGDKTRRTIVGVVKDSKYTSVDESPIPIAYYPYTQVNGVTHLEVEVRVSGRATELLPSVQRAIHALDPNLPLENPMTQDAVFEQSYSQQRMFSRLSAFFGLLAAFLVAVGLYGTLAYRLARRTSEIGVRMALGARPSGILWMVLRENLQLTAIGLAFGLLIAIISVGLIKSLLYGLQPHDPITFVTAFVMVIMVSLAASFLPARYAASIAPMQALRIE